MNIGIIGTAGRKEDSGKITKESYLTMCKRVHTILSSTKTTVKLISGGAAVADHIAVLVYLTYPDAYQLKLHLPRTFNMELGKFDEHPGKFDVGSTANFYHQKFSNKCDMFSLEHIKQAIEKGCEVVVTEGFKQRNTKVAEDSDLLIALTYGNKNQLKDGGTCDTVQKYHKLGKTKSYHIDLNSMEIFTPAKA